MSLKAKYQYTHFIYPFIIDSKMYTQFIESIVNKDKEWTLKIHNQKENEELYSYFLPYMRKFLFPTLFWGNQEEKQYKALSNKKKANAISKLTSISFEYNISSIKVGKISSKEYGTINFDISKINLICFGPGICFIDIKTEVEDENSLIEFNKILDFNHYFRSLTPRAISKLKSKASIKAKNIDNIEDIAIFINSIISGYETSDLEKICYDKMFTYSYVCIDGWEKDSDFNKMKNDFLKFQYVIDSNSSAVFNENCDKLNDNIYSRWKFSMFGFSRESGVVFVSDKEKYDVTVMPYNFENTHMYMLFLAFFQRISLINFSQDLMKQDKSQAKNLKSKLIKFTHLSWFSQITNSENGMDIWKRWQVAFELPELYEEVHKQYVEYYETVVSNGQDRINILLVLLYVISVLFTGFQLINNLFNIENLNTIVVSIMLVAVFSYPAFLLGRHLKHKFDAKYNRF